MQCKLLLLSTLYLISVTFCASKEVNELGVVKKWFQQCSQKPEFLKCFKIQVLKVADRALNVRSLNLVDGISLVGNSRQDKSIKGIYLNDSKLEKLNPEELDNLLGETTSRFLDTHKLEVNLPKVLEEGRQLIVEGRGKKDKGHNFGALYWALAIKGSFLAMAYQGIAVMSGTALIIGKMALLLTAILGLKKLVDNKHEKTTVEIIKEPHKSYSETYSSSYEDEHDKYRRAYDANNIQRKIYRYQIPAQ